MQLVFRIPRSAPSCAFLAHALVSCFCYTPFLALEVSPGHRHRFASLLFVPQRFFYHAVAMIAWLRSCAAVLHPVSLPRSLPSDWACPVGTVQGPAYLLPVVGRAHLFLIGRVSSLPALSATWMHFPEHSWAVLSDAVFGTNPVTTSTTTTSSRPLPLPELLLPLPLPLPLHFHYHHHTNTVTNTNTNANANTNTNTNTLPPPLSLSQPHARHRSC